MIHTLIQYSQRFAGLMLLAVLAVTVAPAQSQNKKAVLEKKPATKDIKIQPKETAKKPAERILEVKKTPAEKNADLRRVREGIAVGEPTGVSPKKEAVDVTGGKQRGIAVGEPTGVSPKKEAVDVTGGKQRGIALGEKTGGRVEETPAPVLPKGCDRCPVEKTPLDKSEAPLKRSRTLKEEAEKKKAIVQEGPNDLRGKKLPVNKVQQTIPSKTNPGNADLVNRRGKNTNGVKAIKVPSPNLRIRRGL